MLKETRDYWSVKFRNSDGEHLASRLGKVRLFDLRMDADDLAARCLEVSGITDARPVRVRVTVEAMEE